MARCEGCGIELGVTFRSQMGRLPVTCLECGTAVSYAGAGTEEASPRATTVPAGGLLTPAEDSGCSSFGCLGVIVGGFVGLIVGAVAGVYYLSIITGPAGAIFGGLFGGLLGDRAGAIDNDIVRIVGFVVGVVVGGIAGGVVGGVVGWGIVFLAYS